VVGDGVLDLYEVGIIIIIANGVVEGLGKSVDLRLDQFHLLGLHALGSTDVEQKSKSTKPLNYLVFHLSMYYNKIIIV